jgi:hypothetical protein
MWLRTRGHGYDATVSQIQTLVGYVVCLRQRDTQFGQSKNPRSDRGGKTVNAMNETERVPSISLSLARVYLNAADPKLATRTWQDVMQDIVAKNKDETRRRWNTAIKDRNFDCIRNLPVAETRPEHFDKALADGKVSTNVYLRRIHNHALGMEWC